jgi:ketosteroid isomerase-like protein
MIVKKLSIATGLLVVLASLGATGQAAAQAAGKDKAAAELIAVDDAWAAAGAARNVEKVASFYAKDGVALPPDAPIAVGYAAARKVWADAFADPSYQISWKATGAEVVNDMGYTVGTFKESAKGAGGKIVTRTGKFLCVWRRGADQQWKAIRDMWNYDAK